MAKVGDKFVIEISGVLREYEGLRKVGEVCRIKGFDGILLDENRLNKLDKWHDYKGYMSQEQVEKAKGESYRHGFDGGKERGQEVALHLIKSNEGDAYQKGLNDAWKAARKVILDECLGGIGDRVIKDIVFESAAPNFVLQTWTAEKAIEKIKAYEEKKKAEKKAEEEELQKAKETMKEILDNSQTRNEFLAKVLEMPEIAEVIKKREVE